MGRGGSWFNDAGFCRSAYRYFDDPGFRVSILGFRLLAVVKRPSQPTAGETARDGRFIAYDNGTVLDTRTNLMWAAKDNGDNIN